eukprot:1753770-Pyramimonas_sp.AAC.1
MRPGAFARAKLGDAPGPSSIQVPVAVAAGSPTSGDWLPSEPLPTRCKVWGPKPAPPWCA